MKKRLLSSLLAVVLTAVLAQLVFVPAFAAGGTLSVPVLQKAETGQTGTYVLTPEDGEPATFTLKGTATGTVKLPYDGAGDYWYTLETKDSGTSPAKFRIHLLIEADGTTQCVVVKPDGDKASSVSFTMAKPATTTTTTKETTTTTKATTTTTKTTTKKASKVNTGDPYNLTVFIALAVEAALALILIVAARRKTDEEDG